MTSKEEFADIGRAPEPTPGFHRDQRRRPLSVHLRSGRLHSYAPTVFPPKSSTPRQLERGSPTRSLERDLETSSTHDLTSLMSNSYGRSVPGQTSRAISLLGRVIVFDERGTGFSDRSVGLRDTEGRMDDIRSVMGAAGSPNARPGRMPRAAPIQCDALRGPHGWHSGVAVRTPMVRQERQFSCG